jgi:23S rRNA pseudouridine2457 synthase
VYIDFIMNQSKSSSSFRYIILNKPYGVLSQFTSEGGKKALSEFGPFPRDVYAVGRLDVDSEGLLLLTNDNRLKRRLTDPRFQHPRTYVAQVEHVPTEDSLKTLREGVVIEGKKTRPAEVRALDQEPALPPRSVQIRFRKTVPTAWLEITLREGRNRQVRKMTAAVGHPTLRLVRTKLGALSLEGLLPGEYRELTPWEIDELMKSVR